MEVSAEVLILMLRVAAVVLLYLFLFSLVHVVQRELRAQTQDRGATAPRARLVVVDSGSTVRTPGQVIPLETVTRLGRSRENTVILDDEHVSSSHAMVTLRDGRWWVRDEDSTNGTLVNGVRIDSEAPLREGDEIQIGRVRLRLAGY